MLATAAEIAAAMAGQWAITIGVMTKTVLMEHLER
jgi:hypothetical protein